MKLRADGLEFRKKEASERQKEYNKLTVLEKVARLDAKLGVGIGAKKQRARLAQQAPVKPKKGKNGKT